MTSEGLGEMFEGNSADTRAGKFPLVPMGSRAEGLACADPGARTPIGASGIPFRFSIKIVSLILDIQTLNVWNSLLLCLSEMVFN